MRERRQRLDSEELAQVAGAAWRACEGEPAVRLAYLHGSAARGEPARDVDIALLLTPGTSGEECWKVAQAIWERQREWILRRAAQ